MPRNFNARNFRRQTREEFSAPMMTRSKKVLTDLEDFVGIPRRSFIIGTSLLLKGLANIPIRLKRL